jgi:hypothetical protein
MHYLSSLRSTWLICSSGGTVDPTLWLSLINFYRLSRDERMQVLLVRQRLLLEQHARLERQQQELVAQQARLERHWWKRAARRAELESQQ